MKVRDKVIMVTGGGNGIGQQVVLECLRRGARVAAADIRDEGLRQTSKIAGAGERLTTHVLDITNREATRALPAAVIAAHGASTGPSTSPGSSSPSSNSTSWSTRPSNGSST